MIPVETYEYDDDAEDSGRPSKSQKKRDMQVLQDLGSALVGLSTDQLKKIEIPEDLRLAVREAQRIKPRSEGMRRQLQFIGKLMRKADPEPIRTALDEITGNSAAAVARMHALENLRVRLLADEQVIGEIVAEHPSVDVQYLRQLRRNALKQAEQGRPPQAFREIFRVLKSLDGGSDGQQPNDEAEPAEDEE